MLVENAEGLHSMGTQTAQKFILSWGQFPLREDAGQCLATFLVVVTGVGGLILASSGRGARDAVQEPCLEQASPNH